MIPSPSMKVWHVAMHACYIGPTDTTLAPESPHSGSRWKYLGAGNLSALIFSVPADMTVISLFYKETIGLRYYGMLIDCGGSSGSFSASNTISIVHKIFSIPENHIKIAMIEDADWNF